MAISDVLKEKRSELGYTLLEIANKMYKDGKVETLNLFDKEESLSLQKSCKCRLHI